MLKCATQLVGIGWSNRKTFFIERHDQLAQLITDNLSYKVLYLAFTIKQNK